MEGVTWEEKGSTGVGTLETWARDDCSSPSLLYYNFLQLFAAKAKLVHFQNVTADLLMVFPHCCFSRFILTVFCGFWYCKCLVTIRHISYSHKSAFRDGVSVQGKWKHWDNYHFLTVPNRRQLHYLLFIEWMFYWFFFRNMEIVEKAWREMT